MVDPKENNLMPLKFPLLIIFLITFDSLFSPSALFPQENLWKKMDEGLYLSDFHSKKITLLKIDPTYYSFKLLSASEKGDHRLTVKEWCQKHHLISAINAGMYQKDGIKNVGYMKNFSHINNPKLNKRYKALLTFNPIEASLPEIQIIDMTCQDFETLMDKYQTLIQGIRMISCRQENVWQKQDKKWSTASFGIDKRGNGLFIFAEFPYSVHDLIDILLSLPISIYNMMYLEGGPEAALYFSASGVEFERVGYHEGSPNEEGFPRSSRPIPNVIGIARR